MKELEILFGKKFAGVELKDLKKSQNKKVLAFLELKKALEVQEKELVPGTTLDSSRRVFEYFHALLRDEKKEKFFSVLLDTKNCIIKKDLISVGTLNLCIVHPREVFATAIREAANSIILVHNHPSGSPNPSPEDDILTHRLVKSGEIIGIQVVDHVIVGNPNYYSYAEMGKIYK